MTPWVEALKREHIKPLAAVVWPGDESTLHAVRTAVEAGLIEAVMIGCREQVEREFADLLASDKVSIVDADDSAQASAIAVRLAREGRARLIMKGLVNTDVLLKAVLNKEEGILEPGRVLTHIAIADIPCRDKLLFFTDAAVLPYPTETQREQQLACVLDVCRAMGLARPRVALIHCSEKVNERHFPFTAHYRELAQRAQAGEWGDCVVDGPFDVKTSCDAHAAAVKGISSELNGSADALIFPDIESGNVFYKTITLFAGATTAGLLCGTRVPVVVPSRGDDMATKFYSIAAACRVAMG